MALGSADEAKLWCAYARDLGFADARTSGAWQAAFEEIARMLQGLLRKLNADLAKSDH
jgi:four helix bundle protein